MTDLERKWVLAVATKTDLEVSSVLLYDLARLMKRPLCNDEDEYALTMDPVLSPSRRHVAIP